MQERCAYTTIAPPEPLPEVMYPFQQVCGDLFDVAGMAFLVLVDRYMGWPVVAQMEKASLANLVIMLKEYFSVFGVPEVFTSDGGPQFISHEIKSIFTTWV